MSVAGEGGGWPCRGDQGGVLFLPRQSIVHEPRYIGTPQVRGDQQNGVLEDGETGVTDCGCGGEYSDRWDRVYNGYSPSLSGNFYSIYKCLLSWRRPPKIHTKAPLIYSHPPTQLFFKYQDP